MRLSNRSKTPLYNFINTLLLMFVLIGFLSFSLEEYRFNILGSEAYLLIVIPLIILLFFYIRGRQIFEYDSDGEALHFRNRNIIPFLSTSVNDEFPKYKLINYETLTVLFIRRLYVTISSKSNGSSTLKYEISYLTKKEIRDLKFSLNKVVKENKERRQQEK